MITLVHFHLHDPIMVGKKKMADVQFYTEVMDSVQTLDVGRRSAYDPDELEEEQRERDMRNKVAPRPAASFPACRPRGRAHQWQHARRVSLRERGPTVVRFCVGPMQINKQFQQFVKRMQQDIWDRDFG